ncbi:MAG: hypothetical protein HF314_17890 [Ignavibacteria bacterium]|jgi:hypothetical protein|nr:hypothetical protein [Ignavibacteria bacterium]MCU7504960.1 hypothetical protein [Ignavibacteria bacterium]MCU7514906.1 hypothetical protein [Ignavibacteria bacterium]
MDDIFIYSEENLLKQIDSGAYELGYYKVRFYTEKGRPAEKKTDTISYFYLYPSGGALRDEKMNIVHYIPKFDTYRGFVPPYKKRST